MSLGFASVTVLLISMTASASTATRALESESSPSSAAASQKDPQAFVYERLGLELSVASSLLRRSIVSTDSPYGFLVTKVAPASAAARAGLKAGDIVLEWDGAPIRTVRQLADAAERLNAAGRSGASIQYARKRPNVRLTFPATDPWETRCTRIRAGSGERKRGRPI